MDHAGWPLTISDGEWSTLFASPLSIGLWTLAIVGFVLPIVIGRFFRPRIASKARDEGADPD